MQHYFIEKEHKASDYFEFEDTIADMKLKFRSCDSIFSKNQVDLGTQTLLNTVFDKVELKGNGLDLGCGYGDYLDNTAQSLGGIDGQYRLGIARELGKHVARLVGIYLDSNGILECHLEPPLLFKVCKMLLPIIARGHTVGHQNNDRCDTAKVGHLATALTLAKIFG